MNTSNQTEHPMKMKQILAAGAVLATATSMLAFAPSAQATETTLTVTSAGSLAISAPTTTVDLGSLAAGVTATAAPNALGTVTVADSRTGLLDNGWIASVSSTDFSGVHGEEPVSTETPITAANVGYTPGTATVNDGSVVATPTAAVSLATSAPVVTAVGLGQNNVSWSPTVSFTIGENIVAGTYTGTITHSVL